MSHDINQMLYLKEISSARLYPLQKYPWLRHLAKAHKHETEIVTGDGIPWLIFIALGELGPTDLGFN